MNATLYLRPFILTSCWVYAFCRLRCWFLFIAAPGWAQGRNVWLDNDQDRPWRPATQDPVYGNNGCVLAARCRQAPASSHRYRSYPVSQKQAQDPVLPRAGISNHQRPAQLPETVAAKL